MPKKAYGSNSQPTPATVQKIIKVKAMMAEGATMEKACQKVKLSHGAYYQHRDKQLDNAPVVVVHEDATAVAARRPYTKRAQQPTADVRRLLGGLAALGEVFAKAGLV